VTRKTANSPFVEIVNVLDDAFALIRIMRDETFSPI